MILFHHRAEIENWLPGMDSHHQYAPSKGAVLLLNDPAFECRIIDCRVQNEKKLAEQKAEWTLILRSALNSAFKKLVACQGIAPCSTA